MRLPTVNQRQVLLENARELNVAIWRAHQAGEAYVVPGDPEPAKSRKAAALQGNQHSFWRARGFRLSVTLTAERRIQMRLDVATVKPRRPAPAERDEDLAWRQPQRKGQAA